jgi:hypothetical protein
MVVHEKNVSMSFYPRPWLKMTNCGHFDSIYLKKMSVGILVENVKTFLHTPNITENIVIHSEVNDNVLSCTRYMQWWHKKGEEVSLLLILNLGTRWW